MMKLNFAFALLVLISCNNPAVKQESSPINTETNPVNMEADYLRTRDLTIQYLMEHTGPGSKYEGGEAGFIKLETDSMQHLEKQLRQILKGSRLTNLSSEGKLNLEALSEGLGFGMLDGLTIREGKRMTFCTSASLFARYFGNDTASALEHLEPAVLEGIFQAALYSDAVVTNFSMKKIASPKGSFAYGMVATVAQDIGPFPPQLLLVLFADPGYIYMVEEPLQAELNKLPACKHIWDSISSVSDESFNRYKQSGLKDTAAFNSHIRLEQQAWKEYSNCYRSQLIQDPQFKAIEQQMDKMIPRIN